MAAFLYYWKPEEVVARAEHEKFKHAAGDQLDRLSKGDILWVFTRINGFPFLAGRMEVGETFGMKEARKRYGAGVYQSETHLTGKRGHQEDFKLLEMRGVINLIRFDSKRHDRYATSQGKVNGQQVRALRKLTAQSHKLLLGIWGNGIASHSVLPAGTGNAIEDFGRFSVHLRDARTFVKRPVVQRIGQPQFRNHMLVAYEGKCAVTRCDTTEALEAAHIIPYKGSKANHPSNGILMRADIHLLFDLGLLQVHWNTYKIGLSPNLLKSEYRKLHGKRILLPSKTALWPSKDALKRRNLKARGYMQKIRVF